MTLEVSLEVIEELVSVKVLGEAGHERLLVGLDPPGRSRKPKFGPVLQESVTRSQKANF